MQAEAFLWRRTSWWFTALRKVLRQQHVSTLFACRRTVTSYRKKAHVRCCFWYQLQCIFLFGLFIFAFFRYLLFLCEFVIISIRMLTSFQVIIVCMWVCDHKYKNVTSCRLVQTAITANNFQWNLLWWWCWKSYQCVSWTVVPCITSCNHTVQPKPRSPPINATGKRSLVITHVNVSTILPSL